MPKSSPEDLSRTLDDVHKRAVVVSLREYVEAMFQEKDRALTMAADEREKAAEVLRQEQHRALAVAESEREKAAQALREADARRIDQGDERLREHINNQIDRVNADFISANLLELERIGREHDGLVALAVKLDVIREAAKEAQDKFEATAERDKEKQNEFRGALDDLSQRMALRRDVDDGDEKLGRRIDENQAQISELRSRIDVGPAGLAPLQHHAARQDGRAEGVTSVTAAVYTLAGLAIGAVGVLIALLTR